MPKETRTDNEDKMTQNNDGVYIFCKKLGETPLEAINRFRVENRNNNPELDFLPITYAGRLDPMAEGLLILLAGERAKEKEKFLNLKKTYEFEVLWGVETDTLDLLGRVVKSEKSKVESGAPNAEEIQEYLEKSVGKFEQMYPAFSSRPVGGKPLFEWAREGRIKDIDIPKHEVEIYLAKFLERKEYSPEKIQEEILRRVGLVGGDFRQESIKEDWEKYFDSPSQQYFIDKFQIEASSGFYVRQFVSDMARNMNTYATTFFIKRLKIGTFSLQNII